MGCMARQEKIGVGWANEEERGDGEKGGRLGGGGETATDP